MAAAGATTCRRHALGRRPHRKAFDHQSTKPPLARFIAYGNFREHSVLVDPCEQVAAAITNRAPRFHKCRSTGGQAPSLKSSSRQVEELGRVRFTKKRIGISRIET